MTTKQPRRTGLGFTLLELLLVVAMLAVAAGMVTLSVRDRSAQKLEEEGARLSALLESARSRSRTLGRELRWQPLEDAPGFRFLGLPSSMSIPDRWLDEETRAEVLGGLPFLSLGPEPIVEAQRVVLTLRGQRLILATDGLGPFVTTMSSEEAHP